MRPWNAFASLATLPFKRDKHAQWRWVKFYLGWPQIVEEDDGTRWSISPKWSPAILSMKDYEQEAGRWLTARFEQYTGELFVDAGANVGRYAIRAALAGMKVWAFEPIPANVEGLRRNMALNDVEMVIIQAALGETSGVVKMRKSFSESKFDPKGDIEVPMVPLDHYKLRPRLIKVDLEGAERKFLLGAVETINACHPTILLELHIDMMTADEAESVRALLRGFGYSLTTVRSRPAVEHIAAEFPQ